MPTLHHLHSLGFFWGFCDTNCTTMSPSTSCHDPESLSASGRSAEKLSLPALQSKMKRDPESYDSELNLVYSQFNSYLNLFQQQAALSFSVVGGDPTVAKELGDRATFLAHVTPLYPTKLVDFPRQLAELLRTSARSLPSSLRCHVAQALILLTNRKVLPNFLNLIARTTLSNFCLDVH